MWCWRRATREPVVSVIDLSEPATGDAADLGVGRGLQHRGHPPRCRRAGWAGIDLYVSPRALFTSLSTIIVALNAQLLLASTFDRARSEASLPVTNALMVTATLPKEPAVNVTVVRYLDEAGPCDGFLAGSGA